MQFLHIINHAIIPGRPPHRQGGRTKHCQTELHTAHLLKYRIKESKVQLRFSGSASFGIFLSEQTAQRSLGLHFVNIRSAFFGSRGMVSYYLVF
jgi:hypothetical protein